MRSTGHRNGMHERPFPLGGKTRAEREEDEFMRLHGGAGPRTIYRVIGLIEAALLAFGRKEDVGRKQQAGRACGRPLRTHP
ncbi:MAG: hypothetical protein RIA09_16685 [Hoeflea sp.]|uniref:hypothetical protein n=1 Tax=Hoeflea sp. TaxID=1940281 RepID=UPI0032ECECFA